MLSFGFILIKGFCCNFVCTCHCCTDANVERYVLTFTLRDSPDCFINVSCWGGEQHVMGLASQFHIGHVGEIFFHICSCNRL